MAGGKYKTVRERGSNIIFPVILRMLGRISRGEGDGKIIKMGIGKNIKL